MSALAKIGSTRVSIRCNTAPNSTILTDDTPLDRINSHLYSLFLTDLIKEALQAVFREEIPAAQDHLLIRVTRDIRNTVAAMLVQKCTIAQAKAAIRTMPVTCSNCIKQLQVIEWRDQGHRKACMRDLTQEIKAREQVVYMYEKGLATAKKLQDQVTAQAAKEAGRVQLHINAEAAAKAAKVPAGKKTVTQTKHAFTIM